jgi:hypothetical protein
MAAFETHQSSLNVFASTAPPREGEGTIGE